MTLPPRRIPRRGAGTPGRHAGSPQLRRDEPEERHRRHHLEPGGDVQRRRQPGLSPSPGDFPAKTFDATTLRAAGWDTVSFGGPSSPGPRTVALDTMADGTCASRWRDPLTAGQICTYTPGRDTCRHDSGGPLAHRYGTRPYLVAVVSHSQSCAGSTPTVNTRVIPYINWIKPAAPS
ncbi:trypsin-like serine protease [Streptomyces sp. NPDC056309]|uniref:trypsin-like serine protease n=1 Tax=unclassified Streptomyces TaxID=2593676 RepID=UPI0035D7F18A